MKVGVTKNRPYWFTWGLSDILLDRNFGIFIISSIASKKDEPKCPFLPILAGSLECVSLATMSSTESSIFSSSEPMDLSGCYSTPSPKSSSPSSSRSSGVRSLSRKHDSYWWLSHILKQLCLEMLFDDEIITRGPTTIFRVNISCCALYIGVNLTKENYCLVF